MVNNNNGKKQNLASPDFFRQIVEKSGLNVCAFNEKGEITFSNQAWLDRIGYSQIELSEMTVWDLLEPDYVSSFKGVCEFAIRHEKERFIVGHFASKDGEVLVMDGAILPWLKDGGAVGTIFASWDVTYYEDRKEEQDSFFNLIPIILFYKDTRNNFIKVNQKFSDILEVPKEYLEGKSLAELFPSDAKNYFSDDDQVIKSGKPKLGIIEPITGRGGIRWLKVDKYPLFDKKGLVKGIICVGQDITDAQEK